MKYIIFKFYSLSYVFIKNILKIGIYNVIKHPYKNILVTCSC